jgi:rod shape-determining protein MreD
MLKLQALSRRQLLWGNGVVNVLSVALCALLLPTRWPGMELVGTAPNWLMMWVVAWSVKRSVWQAVVAGVVLGAIHDGMNGTQVLGATSQLSASRILALVVVGVLTAMLHKQRYIQEEIASIALITFFMTLVYEGVIAAQLLSHGQGPWWDWSQPLWQRYQQVALAAAILSSLWMPVLYYPLDRWWQRVEAAE